MHIALLLVWLIALSGCGPNVSEPAPGRPSPVSELFPALRYGALHSLQDVSGQELEKAFVSQRLEYARALLDLAREGTRFPESNPSARRLRASEEKVAIQLGAWFKSWYRSNPDGEERRLVRDDLKALAAAPTRDSVTYYRKLLAVYDRLNEMTELLEHEATRSELKEWAASQSEAIAAEQSRLKGLIKSAGARRKK